MGVVVYLFFIYVDITKDRDVDHGGWCGSDF